MVLRSGTADDPHHDQGGRVRRPAGGAAAGAARGVAILTGPDRSFVERARVARLATADRAGNPHLVPVCFALAEAVLYITVDEKPKRNAPLKRLRNIVENPSVAVTIDRYDEDWSRLGWVMLRGPAEILASGAEHDQAQALLRAKYPQLLTMRIEDLPVIAVRIAKVTSWGDLTPEPG